MVPTDATTTGTCIGKTANMTLSWEEPVKGYNNKKNKITFNYSHDNSKFFLDSIFVDLHGNNFSYIELHFILQKYIHHIILLETYHIILYTCLSLNYYFDLFHLEIL